MRNADRIELSPRERRAMVEENVGLREFRRTRIEWRALQALITAVEVSTAAA